MSTTALTTLKFISITCERSLERKVLELLRVQGVKSVRMSDTRIVEFSEESEVDLNGSQVKIECLASITIAQNVIEVFQKKFLNKFDIGFFVTDALVMRPQIFCSE
jgi:hypothetical protein